MAGGVRTVSILTMIDVGLSYWTTEKLIDSNLPACPIKGDYQ
jgi:hypothetical protein